MSKNARDNVNASILESLRGATVPSGPPLTEGGLSGIDGEEGHRPGAPSSPSKLLGSARSPAKPRREAPAKAVRRVRVGRKAPDKPKSGGSGNLAKGAGFTLYSKDNRRIEAAITALRKRGFTSGINRSTITRLALMNLPNSESELVRLFRELGQDK